MAWSIAGDGSAVPLTQERKDFFDGGSAIDTRDLTPKETIEQLIPLAELFEMKTRGEYTVLASVPVIDDVDAVLTAAPLEVRIDRKPAAARKYPAAMPCQKKRLSTTRVPIPRRD